MMKVAIVCSWFFSLLVFTASVVYAQEKAPAGSADRGYQAYMKYQCYTCHGTVGQGADRGTGPRLAPGVMPYPAFALQTRTPRLDMPPYRQKFLTDQELADIYAYLLTVKSSPAAKEIPLLNF
jgi:mono/diheme cytochrome c family protein